MKTVLNQACSAYAGWSRSTGHVNLGCQLEQPEELLEQPEELMITQPLHPAVVHFPIVFVVVLPIVAVIAIISIHRGAAVRPAWLPVIGIAGALALSSWLAVETGEDEEDAVEEVVPESAMHDHEESAELFFPLTIAGLVLVSAGLVKGRPGQLLRGAAVVGALGLSVAGYQVGHTGGELVYEYGAADAYARSGGEDRDDREDDSERRSARNRESDERH